MHDSLLFLLIVFPFLAGLASYAIRNRPFRVGLVLVSAAIVSVSSILLATSSPFVAAPETMFGIGIESLITLADFVLLFVILYVGLKHRHPAVIGVAAVQLVLLFYLDFILIKGEHSYPLIHCDILTATVSLVVALVGSVIAIYALPYMKTHEAHVKKPTAGEPRFFAVILLFFGAMHGLILTNSILHLYFFFEVTSLCSFLLIGHDRTPIARRNSLIALWMNSLGGVVILLGSLVIYSTTGTLEIQALIKQSPEAGLVLFGVAFLAIGGMIKAAQLPFQRWLLGAMVAPTPVSALLHSSTMVKAGVYICLRFAPVYVGSFVGYSIALCGAFTFVITAALALSQSNGKKVLAYSTISNLGLIIACAGINTPTAIVVGMMLIVFHAVSKALLFLCVGTVEQTIGSRDIEVMRGVYGKMPMTAIIASLGVLTMILPPFGMLFGKWAAIESAHENLLVILMFAVGSAFTVMYWARWVGTMLDFENPSLLPTPGVERQAPFTRLSLVALCGAALLLPLAAPWMYGTFSMPVLIEFSKLLPQLSAGVDLPGLGMFQSGGMLQQGAANWVPTLFFIALLGFLFAFQGLRKAREATYSPPYMNGVNLPEHGTFRGPMRSVVRLASSNYYFEKYFGESKLTVTVNVAAGLLLLLLLGGGL